VTVAADGSLYVMDKGNYRIVHLSSEGKLLRAFGKLGTGEQDIFYGWDIQLGPDDNLYICNLAAQEDIPLFDGIKVFTSRGAFVRDIGRVDYDPDAELTNNPYALYIDSQGRIYLADYNPGVVRIFTPQGELLGELFGVEREFTFGGLGDLAIDETRGLMYVADFNNGTVEQFRFSVDEAGVPSAEHQATFGRYGRGEGELAFPQGLAVHADSGLVFVGDQANRRIQVFDSQGNYVRQFSPVKLSPERGGVSDWQVLGVEVNQDLVYAVDSLNNLIWVFTLEGEFVRRVEAHR
jgi:DNA-binding beta-propeller fold protein YncE